MPDPLAELRAAFPVAGRWIYFNHAAVAPLAEPVRAAMQEFEADASAHGSAHFEAWLQRRERARSRAARLIGARPDDVAFTTSTSQGLALVAEGLDWRAGDEIVVVQDDFPANQIPWFRQARHGVKLVVVPRRDGRLPAADILSRVTPATRVVAVPSALYDNGFRLDLAALGAGLADHKAWLVVDAIQTLGAFPLDAEALGIDALSADSHKWMLGLEGIGLFWCRPELRARLDTPFISWMSLAEPFAPYRPDAALRPDARRYEWASLPTVGLFAVDACLEMLHRAGVEAIAARILELTDRLALGLERRGWRLASPRPPHAEAPPAERSGIVTARPPSGEPVLEAGAAVAALAERGVSVTPRGAGVRFSPHGWNTTDEVDALLDRLP